MPLTGFQFASQIAFVISCVFLFALVVRNGSYRRWPFLFSLAAFEAVIRSYLLTLNTIDHYTVYFYTYWAAEAVQGLLILGLIFDIIRRIPGIKYAPSHLAAGFVALAGAISGGCAWLAHSGGSHTFHITMMVLSMDRCIVVTWGAFALSLFWSIGFCGFGWTATLIRMASNLLIFILVCGISIYAMSAWPQYAYQIDKFTSLCITGVWIFWSGIIYLEKETEAVFHSEGASALIAVLLQGLKQNANEGRQHDR